MNHRTGPISHLGRLMLGVAVPASMLLSGCGERTLATFEERFDASEVVELVADLGHGELHIEGQRGRTDVELKAELRAWGPRAFHDDDARDRVQIGWEELDEGSARLVAELRDGDWHDDDNDEYEFNVTVFVPSELLLDLSHGDGDAFVGGVKAVHMDDADGDLVVLDIEDNAVVNDEDGDLQLRRIGGNLFVYDEDGDLEVSGITGSVELKDRSGDIEARHIMGSLRVWDGSGDIDIADATEVIIEEDGSGSVDIR